MTARGRTPASAGWRTVSWRLLLPVVAARDDVLHVRLAKERVLHALLLLERPPRHGALDRVERVRPEARAALDGAGDLARRDRVERGLAAVHRDDQQVL